MLSDLSLGQLQHGMDITIATTDIDSILARDMATKGVDFLEIPALTNVRSVIVASRIINAAHKTQAFDVVHVHTVKALLASILSGPGIFRRTVSTLHNIHQKSSYLLLLARIPVTVSKTHQLSMEKYALKFMKRTRVVLNGTVRSPRVDLISELVPAKVKERSLLYVGGLKERKGVDLLLRYFDEVYRYVPDAHLYLVGNRDNPKMEMIASQLGAKDNIHFVGYDPDPRRYMLSCSALVVPSRREAFGLVVPEARSCNLPVIAADVDGLPEALSGGNAGILIPPLDQSAWVRTMIRMLTDRDWRDGQAALTTVGLENFTVDKMAQKYEDVYRTLSRLQ